MAAPVRFLSGRYQQQKIGIQGSTENQKVLEVVGRTGIGTTIFEPTTELEVRGNASVSGILTVRTIRVVKENGIGGNISLENINASGIVTINSGIVTDLKVSGISTLGLIKISAGIITHKDNISSGITFYGNLVGGSSTSNITNNIGGGNTGNMVYQSSPDNTAFIKNGISGQVLIYGDDSPYWGSIDAGTF